MQIIVSNVGWEPVFLNRGLVIDLTKSIRSSGFERLRDRGVRIESKVFTSGYFAPPGKIQSRGKEKHDDDSMVMTMMRMMVMMVMMMTIDNTQNQQ